MCDYLEPTLPYAFLYTEEPIEHCEREEQRGWGKEDTRSTSSRVYILPQSGEWARILRGLFSMLNVVRGANGRNNIDIFEFVNGATYQSRNNTNSPLIFYPESQTIQMPGSDPVDDPDREQYREFLWYHHHHTHHQQTPMHL